MTETAAKVCPHCSKQFTAADLSFPSNFKRQIYCSNPCQHARKLIAKEDIPARFWSKVEKRGDDECWGWKAQKRWDGYGRFVWNRKPIWAHRYSYELHHGPIPAGMHVLHSCDNPECTNPKHLSIGTHDDNMAECKARGRNTKGERNPRAILTPEIVLSIRAEAGETPRRGIARVIAEKRGYRYETVLAAIRGRSWKHL